MPPTQWRCTMCHSVQTAHAEALRALPQHAWRQLAKYCLNTATERGGQAVQVRTLQVPMSPEVARATLLKVGPRPTVMVARLLCSCKQHDWRACCE